jgi:hypothetical protein
MLITRIRKIKPVDSKKIDSTHTSFRYAVSWHWRYACAADIFSRHIHALLNQQQHNLTRTEGEYKNSGTGSNITCQSRSLLLKVRRNHALSTPTAAPPRSICINSTKFIIDASLFDPRSHIKLARLEVSACCIELSIRLAHNIRHRRAAKWHQEESGPSELHAEL